MSSVDDGLASLLAGYSTPSIPFDPAVHREIVVTHATHVCRQFLIRYEGSLPPDLHAAARHMVEELDDPVFYWDWTMGQIQACLSPQGGDALLAVVALLYRAARLGFDASWRVTLPRQSSLRVDDRVTHWVMEVESTPGADGPQVLLRRGREGDACEEQQLQRVAMEGPAMLTLLDSRSAPTCVKEHEFTRTAELVERIDVAGVRSLQRAAELLDAHVPAYGRWVARLVKEIVVIKSPGERLLSGSASDAPGVISLCEADTMALVEMMVHEASHQYFHVATRLGAVDTGEDQKLYYSPAKERPRPLSRIVLAFHAFANVLVALRAAQSSVPTLAANESRLEKLVLDVEAMAKVLHTSKALTPLGRALVDPLLVVL